MRNYSDYYANEVRRLELVISGLNEKIYDLEEKIRNSRPDDDVLFMRIRNLEATIARERRQHKAEISDLKYNLEGVKEAYFKLLKKQRENEANPTELSQQIADEHIDILATLMALYPFTPTDDLTLEFGIKRHHINFVSQVLGVVKSKEARQEARKYLQKQNIAILERRGGDKGNHPQRKKIEKVARNGRVVATYESIMEAAKANGLHVQTVSSHCGGKFKGYTHDGYRFRYKKS